MSESMSEQETFRKLKVHCVPLLGNSLLSPSSVNNASHLLSDLITTLRDVQSSDSVLTTSLISYTFFPLATILRRNELSTIPDQVLEKILVVLGILFESWQDCDWPSWDQAFLLCGAILGGIERKSKQDRDDETKAAAAQCLHSLLRGKHLDEKPQTTPSRAVSRLSEIQAHANTAQFIRVLGQALDALLGTSQSQHLPLQRLSLQVLFDIITIYAPSHLLPSVIPGTITSMTKVALGAQKLKGWAKGEIVAAALKVMQEIIVRSIGDEICIKEGVIRRVENLAEFSVSIEELQPQVEPQVQPFATVRTPVWIQATSSQLHIAMNTMTPLVLHPNPSALMALSNFSYAVLAATHLTLPQTQPLLLSFLLSLSVSSLPTVSLDAHENLVKLLASPNTGPSMLHTLMQITRDNLAALPRILPSQADSKIEHLAGLVEATCLLAKPSTKGMATVSAIAGGVGKLLGPTGGIEKWGWSLLSVLHLVNPLSSLSKNATAQLVLEADSETVHWVPFPEVDFRNVSSPTARAALNRMFRSLGTAGGESCLFAVEWFVSVGKRGKGARAVAALWCACRLLEGIANLSLDNPYSRYVVYTPRVKRVEKLARGIARSLAELWDRPETDEEQNLQDDSSLQNDERDGSLVEYIKPAISIKLTPGMRLPRSILANSSSSQFLLHRSLSLQLLSITAGILQARFTSLLLHTFYPVLHSLISPDSHVSSTALATLNFITFSTSYASPASLLLSNFDYALDAVSRRLTRRWLDVNSAEVLAVLVRLVGSDVVQRAGDIVEECFDRLDDFHGYETIVEGLVKVLGEVINVVEVDEIASVYPLPSSKSLPRNDTRIDALLEWLEKRNNPSTNIGDTTDWDLPVQDTGKGKEEAADEEDGARQDPGLDEDLQPTPAQALTMQIVSRSLYFLTHGSPVIRARILKLLTSSVPILPDSALLPSIHQAWPFILNRLADPEPFVIAAAASLVEMLAINFGSFMTRRIWDDVWPRFHAMLGKLDAADSTNALARRKRGGVGTESAYTHSHRLYRSLLKTMCAAAKGIDPRDSSLWEVVVSFRRFLHKEAHEELQACARDLYVAIGVNNEDAVWLALSSTVKEVAPVMAFLREPKWDIEDNVARILDTLMVTT